MMCYLDTTFCSSPNCKNKCGRKPPDDLEQRVLKWWGGEGGPVAYTRYCDDDGELLRRHSS